jgi:glycosyltransferase involved in cell wall biosynthesis
MILFDHQTFIFQRYGGISRMFSEIMKYLTDNNVDFQLPIVYSDNVNLINRSYYKPTRPNYIYKLPDPGDWLFKGFFPGKGRIYNIVKNYYEKKRHGILETNNTLVNNYLTRNQVQVFHPTYFDNYFMETIVKCNKPYIITIYDLIHEKFMGLFSREDMVLKNRFELCSKAACIIAISESTKNDLIEIYNINPKKIKVIHLASSLDSSFLVPIKDFPLKDYILYIGDRWYYKNFRNFLYSVTPIIKKHRVIVVCAGSKPFTQKEIQLMDFLGIRGKVVYIPISNDGNLSWLYSNARLFVFPSLYEGFGIPLLEAMSLNCPVACSNTSSFPEVVGDAARVFDPWNVESMTDAIQKVFESNTLRNQLINKGKERIKLFSWEKCGEEHLKIYKEF